MGANGARLAAAVLLMTMLALSAPGPAAAARPLRRMAQYTNSLAGPSQDTDKDMALASTVVAESRSQGNTLGIAHDRTTQVAIASDAHPGPLARGSADELTFHAGASGELPMAAYGPIAISRSDSGAIAVAAAEAMPLAHPAGTPGTAQTTTLSAFDYPPPKLSGGPPIGSSVTTGALNPSNSFGISGSGDGPHAIASAGEAVASSFSEHD
ncbi:hypothetical protein Rsub_11112 [Raphidocelis subcapitata]|uniref:Uncharacterized protein n=1 Tax=Raphidocelis subcapitata TaxID=307507 RepID=A0A2V0PDS3_9CHLO|nr:hypothetical protein Rsub_11112 [Raphidocelis subcapitata]|eukprot:GBF98001.1 hypothetical protein Rsub_11112 [Raphidocelis subcapitata]